MELILTSFGLTHFQRQPPKADLFYRMPPALSIGLRQALMPDYAVLLLCERVIMDAESFDRLSTGKHHISYAPVAKAIKALHDEGFIRIEDFDSIISDNREFLARMLEHDLKTLDNWISPLKESIKTWQEFVPFIRELVNLLKETHDPNELDSSLYQRSAGLFHHDAGRIRILASEAHSTNYHSSPLPNLVQEALASSTKRRRSQYRGALTQALTDYLAYVNANLVLSNVLGVGFHDWQDFAPFYREKFLGVGQAEIPQQKRIAKVKQLFEISFPEFNHWDAKSAVKALKDRRISDLRNLVDKAINNEVEFDREFAVRVLHEVLGVEQRAAKIRSIISYGTLPIGLIPTIGTPAQKAVEELTERILNRRVKKDFRWFYLISDLGRSPQTPEGNKADSSK